MAFKLCIAITAVLVCCALARSIPSKYPSGRVFGAAMSEGAEIKPGVKYDMTQDCVDRAGMIDRAKSWTNVSMPYCQCNGDCCGNCPYCSTYRCDCSGYVSFIWQLGRGYSTGTLNEVADYISANDLVQGDALVCSSSKGGHVVLFDSWIVKGKTYNCYQEPGCSAATKHAYYGTCDAGWVWSECGSFKPIRFRNACPPGPPPPPPPPAVPSPPTNCSTFYASMCPGSDDCMCSLGEACGLNPEEMLAERRKKLNLRPDQASNCAAHGGTCYNVLHHKCGGGTSCLAQGDRC